MLSNSRSPRRKSVDNTVAHLLKEINELEYKEDLTRVVISYEFYETSLGRVSKILYEMSTTVRFCLSFDPLKRDFIVFKMNDILRRKRHVDTDICQWRYMYAPKCYYTCDHTIFMT